jgi:eukaryotic-like serine/threonine-protein kinase
MERIADYQLVHSLGTGSYGEFYLAVPPPRLNLQADYIAVKVLSGMTNEDAFRRASRELRAFAAVQSPDLVTLYDAGQDGSTFFYSMEWSPLGTLAAPTQAPNAAEVVRAVAAAARAAHALHEGGVLHRSITPASILLTPDGGKLADLGLAEVINPGQTATSVGGVGAVEYIDPKILLGDRASRASDIWSLGATFHRARTGQGIFGDLPPEPLAAIRKVLASTPQLSPALTPPEVTLVQRCLAPVGERYATAADVARDLEALG